MVNPPVMHALWDASGPAFVAAVHGLGGGVWIGAVAFNLFVLTPRARAWFQKEGEHEDFVFSIVHGLRWPVLAGALSVVGTGIWRWRGALAHASEPWAALMLAKLACACITLGLFAWVTVGLWPRRAFATEEELPAIRRLFFRVGVGIVASNTFAAALGVLASRVR